MGELTRLMFAWERVEHFKKCFILLESKAYIGLTKSTKIPPLLSIFDFDACYEGSMGGQIGVKFNQESTGHVGFFLTLLLADQ